MTGGHERKAEGSTLTHDDGKWKPTASDQEQVADRHLAGQTITTDLKRRHCTVVRPLPDSIRLLGMVRPPGGRADHLIS
jgi:hypothetical protein